MGEVSLSGLQGRVWKPSPLRRVDIVAMGHSSSEFINDCYHQPRREKGHEVWTLNSGPMCLYYDKCWNMHDLTKLAKVDGEVDYLPLYKTLERPIITIRALEEIPNTLEFPIAQFVSEYQSNYFGTTVAYMIAGALMCGVEEIWVYGADYNYPGKVAYEKGKGSVEYWLGYAHAKGVKVHVAKTSTLLDLWYRLPGNKGAMQYGEVYGYFDEQPELNEEGKVTGFKKPLIVPHAEEKDVNPRGV